MVVMGVVIRGKMLPKPNSCKGCPFYGDGMGFVPDEIRDNAKVFIYAQNPGKDEEAGRKLVRYDYKEPVYEKVPPAPLLGKTGYSMEREYFPVAGLERKDVSLGNVFRCRHNYTDYLPPLGRPEVQQAMKHCHQAHFKLPREVKLIVAQGEYSLFALTQEGLAKERNISSWRGYVLPFQPIVAPKTEPTQIYTPSQELIDRPVLAVNHLSMLFRSPSGVILAKSDWAKIPRILAGKWPQKPPEILRQAPNSWPAEFAFDTEFVPETGYMIRYSMANKPFGTNKILVRVVERDNTTFGPYSIEPPVVFNRPRLITQNALADISFFQDISGLAREGFDLEDIMHIHAVLWAGLPHDLNTFGSLYSSINRWKHLEYINPIVYSGMDAHGTLEAFWRMREELLRDPKSHQVYHSIQLKLVDVISRSASFRGMKVNQAKAIQYMNHYKAIVDDLYLKAQAVTGWPINVSSNDMTKQQLYEVEKIQDLAFPKYKRGKI